MNVCIYAQGKMEKIIIKPTHFKLLPTFYVATNGTLVETIHNTIIFCEKYCIVLQLKRVRNLNENEFSLLV